MRVPGAFVVAFWRQWPLWSGPVGVGEPEYGPCADGDCELCDARRRYLATLVRRILELP